MPPDPSTIPSPRRCRASIAAKSASYRASLRAASGRPGTVSEVPPSRHFGWNPERARSRSNQRSPSFSVAVEVEDLRCLDLPPFGARYGIRTRDQPDLESGALPTELTEIGDDRLEPMSGTQGINPRFRYERISELPAPLDGRHQRSLLSKRRRWESNPHKAALQAAAFPSGSDVDSVSIQLKVSSPGFEPGPRPSQSRVRSTTLRGRLQLDVANLTVSDRQADSRMPSPPAPLPQGERGEDLHATPVGQVPRTLTPFPPLPSRERGRG